MLFNYLFTVRFMPTFAVLFWIKENDCSRAPLSSGFWLILAMGDMDRKSIQKSKEGKV
jgi:hypothetical protein